MSDNKADTGDVQGVSEPAPSHYFRTVDGSVFALDLVETVLPLRPAPSSPPNSFWYPPRVQLRGGQAIDIAEWEYNALCELLGVPGPTFRLYQKKSV